MWRLYTSGSEGVAIKTTIGHFKKAIERDVRAVTIGRVRYIDHNTDDDGLAPSFNVLGPLFCKRQSFRHEREVRAVIANPDEAEFREALSQIKPVLGQTLTVPWPMGQGGLAVPLDISTLVQKIVVSPQFPEWAIGALQKVIERSNLRVIAESSDLLKRP
jgi:hypothetical protein